MDEVLRDRLILLRNEVAYLKRERDQLQSFEAYRDDPRLRRAIERAIQVAIELCLDIARRLISLKALRYPADNQDAFRVLVEEGIVLPDLLPSLLDMARFRNLIVHDYARIDDAKVYVILQKRLGDFDAYAAAITAYLEKA